MLRESILRRPYRLCNDLMHVEKTLCNHKKCYVGDSCHILAFLRHTNALSEKDTAGINSTDFHFPGLTSLAALPGLLVMKPWPIISDC